MKFSIRLGVCLLSAFAAVDAVNPVVPLSYATYQGQPLADGVTQWLGMRYATIPARFSAPKALNNTASSGKVQPATKHGPLCLGTGGAKPDNTTTSEDCLFLDLYAPSGATVNSKLPVYLFIGGGGFNQLTNANYNGSGLVTASNNSIIVANFNYRVGIYGFLAASEVTAGGGSLNNGLLDQRAAMHWVQQYISQFGGDPSQVTLGGDSAGAKSVALHLTAYGGRNDGLWARTLSESQSFYPIRTVSQSEPAFQWLANKTGCTSNAFSCLQNLDINVLQPDNTYPPNNMYGPTLDNNFVTDFTYSAFGKGKYVKLPAIYGDVTNEGTIFANSQTDTWQESKAQILAAFPWMTNDQYLQWNKTYPFDGTPTFQGDGKYWRQLANGLGDMRYTCPGLYLSNTTAAGGQTQNWNYHWNVIDPSDNMTGKGVYHVVELGAVWGTSNLNGAPSPTSYYPGQSNAAISPIVQGYWTSFIRSGDPNTHRVPGTSFWAPWTAATSPQRLMFQTGNTTVEQVDPAQYARCQWLWSIAVSNQQ